MDIAKHCNITNAYSRIRIYICYDQFVADWKFHREQTA